jgi:Bacterial Ig-like domain (group 3)/Autotransporter beta-domain
MAIGPWRSSISKAAIFAVAFTALVSAGGGQAFGSSGCGNLNGTIAADFNNGVFPSSIPATGFTAGDTIKITYIINAGAPIVITDNAGNLAGPQTTNITYKVPSDTAQQLIAGFQSPGSGLADTATVSCTPGPTLTTSTTSVTSSKNPSEFGQSVTFTAIVSASGTPTGNVTFKDGTTVLGTGTLSGGTATLSTAALAVGSHSITATYPGDTNFAGSTSPVLTQTVSQSATTTTITSSLNPSEVGKSVTFTATLSSGGGTPTGTVTFKDGASVLGTGTLSSGIATFTTSSLTLGSHTITANYAGATNFAASVSATLIQAVNTPADSLKLRTLQMLVTPLVAQVSGQAVSGAVDSAISEAFSGNGALVTPSGSGVHFNFAADPDGKPANTAPRSTDPFSSANGSFASGGRSFGTQPSSRADSASPSRVDDAFGALAYAEPTKAPPRYVEQRDWLGWAEVRGANLNHWGTGGLGTVAGAPMLYGSQVNLLAGLTRRLMPNFLVGVLSGYETFDYRSDALQGRLKGDGWTVGSYLGWQLAPNVRFDAAVAYSGIGYDGTAGTAAGTFSGHRWLVSGGLTGTYESFGLQIEPSARVYALWERENSYTDTLGTSQAEHNFSTGRASGGIKVAYPIAWTSTVALTPYVGLYGDYYFNTDSAGALAIAPAIPTMIVLDGGSARAIGGVAAKFANGAQVAVGGERSGIGGNFGLWTYRARASVPFGAQ